MFFDIFIYFFQSKRNLCHIFFKLFETFFFFPFLAAFLGVVTAGIMLCGIATLATAEEIYINEHADVLDVNIKGASELRDHELPHGK